MVCTAYAMSGRVASAAYISDPTASLYGVSLISAYSVVIFGITCMDRFRLCSIGVDAGFRSSKSKNLTTASD
jgi:hypothetical protein